jgi:RHS repeat-associated protein
MKKHRSKIGILKNIFIFAVVAIFGTNYVNGQENNPAVGAKLGHAYSAGQFDTVDTTNGSLMVRFPLGNLPAGRGAATAGVSLNYNSKLYRSRIEKVRDFRYECSVEKGGVENCPYYNKTYIEQADKGGWNFSSLGYTLDSENRLDSLQDPQSCMTGGSLIWAEQTYIHKLRIVFPDGSSHEMHPQGHNDSPDLQDSFYRVRYDGVVENCGSSQTKTGSAVSYYSDDGSYLRLVFSYDSDFDAGNNTWTLYFPDGSKVTSGVDISNPQRIYDKNGNYVTLTSGGYQDQLGRTVSTAGVKGVGGVDIVWTITWKTIYVKKTYQSCAATCPTWEQRSNLDVQWNVVDTITEPSQMGGLTYVFSYNGHPYPNPPPGQSYGWGEISGILLPTRTPGQTDANIAYSYAMDGLDGPSSNGLPDDVDVILRNYPSSKSITHDGVTDTWAYSTTATQGSVTEPDGSSTVNSFSDTHPTIPSWQSGLSHMSESSNGTKVEKIWAQNKPHGLCYVSKACNPYVKTEFTSIKQGGSYSLTSIKDFTYDKNGNVTQVDEYDWVPYASTRNGSGGPITDLSFLSSYRKRRTVTTYYNDTPTASSTDYSDPDSYYAGTNKRLLRLPKSVEIQDASGAAKSRSEVSYDYTNYDSANTKAGNLTSSKTWDSTKGALCWPDSSGSRLWACGSASGNYILTSATYNLYGMPLVTTDPKGIQTTITYGCIDGNSSCLSTMQDLYPTQTEVASNYAIVKRTSRATYDFYTGLPTSSTDVDNGATTSTSYDTLGRPISVSAPNSASTSSTYDDIGRKVITRSDIHTAGDQKKVVTTFFDQLGRVRLTKTLEDPATQSETNETDGIKVETKYKIVSGYTYQLTSNPFRAANSSSETDPTMGWTLATAWNNGIHSEVQTFSGAGLPMAFGGPNTNSTGIVSTDINANATTVTDQAGKLRRSITNGLGQLIRVDEPTDPNLNGIGSLGDVATPNQKTEYTYDVLNNLTTVNQGLGISQRTFTYSSLSRLLTATNPESGTTNYTYDNIGNLTSKTDARSITTGYIYDALNRATQRSYSNDPQNTPTVTYTYDDKTYAKGRLTKVSSSVSTTEYLEFDILGMVRRSKQTTDGVEYGGGTDQTRWMKYTYNASGALTEQQYPSGRVVKSNLDTDGDLASIETKKNAGANFSNYASNFSYNAAKAVTDLKLGNGLWESTDFNSQLQPEMTAIGTTQNGYDKLKLNYTYANNGNMLSQIITVPGLAQPFVQNYTYDQLSRLKTAMETNNGSDTWNQVYGYDRYGNRNITSGVGVTSFTFGGNRITAHSYDNAGNTIADGSGKTFTYDAENKQVQVANGGNSVGQYFVDGDGKRVKKVVPSTGETTIFVYDVTGKLVAEYSTIVASQQDAKVAYLTADHLGSPRINTDATGVVISRHDYHPFGEEIATAQRSGYEGDTVRKQFTGYERDDESGLDFAEARMYNDQIGRFSAVDPLTASASPVNPQTFNRYVYVLNNPLTLVDRTGAYPEFTFSLYVRAFAPFEWFGPGNIARGDNRGFSTSAKDSYRISASSRITMSDGPYQYFPMSVTRPEFPTISETSMFGDSWLRRSPTYTAYPGGGMSDELFGGNDRVGYHAYGNDVAIPFSSDIDIHSDFHFDQPRENSDGTLNMRITGTVIGDQFPAAEAFVRDKAGNAVMLGVYAPHVNAGPVTSLPGDKQYPMIAVDVTVVVKDGLFQGVLEKGSLVSLDEYNKRFTRQATTRNR